MPLYEYLCPECETTFERLRPMAQADDPVRCPEGHEGSRRLISVFAVFSRDASGTSTMVAGNGCACSAGGACGCAGM